MANKLETLQGHPKSILQETELHIETPVSNLLYTNHLKSQV